MISLFVSFIIKFCNKVDLMDFIKSLSSWWFFNIFEKSVNRNGSSFWWQMLSFIISNSLVVIMETNFFWSQESKTSEVYSMFLGQSDEISSIIFLRVCIVNNNTVSLQNLLLSDLITFLFCLQSISIYSGIFRKIIFPESWLSRSWTTNKNDHFFLFIFSDFWNIFLTNNNLTILWNSFWVESLNLNLLFAAKE